MSTTSSTPSEAAERDGQESSTQPKESENKVVDHPLDIGQFVRNGPNTVPPALSDDTKHEVLTKCWTPEEKYVSPKTSQSVQSRSFRLQSLERWSWLAYSEAQGGGAFCRHYMIFARNEAFGPARSWTLGHVPFNRFKHASRDSVFFS